MLTWTRRRRRPARLRTWGDFLRFGLRMLLVTVPASLAWGYVCWLFPSSREKLLADSLLVNLMFFGVMPPVALVVARAWSAARARRHAPCRVEGEAPAIQIRTHLSGELLRTVPGTSLARADLR